jgi:hypothetical protein
MNNKNEIDRHILKNKNTLVFHHTKNHSRNIGQKSSSIAPQSLSFGFAKTVTLIENI